MDVLEEMRNFRQNLRDLKADNLRSMRYYERKYGKTDSVASFMSGMAGGKAAPLMSIDYISRRLEMEDEYGNS